MSSMQGRLKHLKFGGALDPRGNFKRAPSWTIFPDKKGSFPRKKGHCTKKKGHFSKKKRGLFSVMKKLGGGHLPLVPPSSDVPGSMNFNTSRPFVEVASVSSTIKMPMVSCCTHKIAFFQ